ncbi:hypothetical protein CcCBS67573_g01411 [Chytriomyces confervae]|uniref:histidine kinase n=1 Tax=Chytriomyces confervae TaxID=246404 RepID=A0A507FLR6_9FUNG|nr:hypothetical protein HDU80_004334 [Chytriomyces hyalinus]TPX77339.1 hypothetical protein CcCBS67573_g01411 [Chytriomyces confervae]
MESDTEIGAQWVDAVQRAAGLDGLSEHRHLGCIVERPSLRLVWATRAFLRQDCGKDCLQRLAPWLGSNAIDSGADGSGDGDLVENFFFCQLRWRGFDLGQDRLAIHAEYLPLKTHSISATISICNTDWLGCSINIGPPDSWPTELLSAVSALLNTPTPSVIYVGPEFHVLAANDGADKKMFNNVGQRIRDIYPESWGATSKRLMSVYSTGTPLTIDEAPTPINRHGFLETIYVSVATFPVFGRNGSIVGVQSTFYDNTKSVLQRRRLDTVRNLWHHLNSCKSAVEFWKELDFYFSSNRHDLSRFAIYSCSDHTATLLSKSFDACAASPTIRISNTLGPANTSFQDLVKRCFQERQLIEFTPKESVALSNNGCWTFLPIVHDDELTVRAVIVLAASENVQFDEDCKAFIVQIWQEIQRGFRLVTSLEFQKRHVEELVQMDKSKTSFFTSISHELRTPLTLILGPLESALSADLHTDVRSNLNTAFRNAVRLLKFVDNLLDQQDLDIMDIEPVFRPTNLSGRTLQLVAAFTHIIESAGLEYRLDIARDLTSDSCYLDIMIWEKIVFGLLGNAVKFTSNGFVSCRLTKDLPSRSFKLIVSDSGHGHYIPSEPLSSTNQPDLMKIDELVKLHHGTLQVENMKGHGTSVTVTIPMGFDFFPIDRILDVHHEMEPEDFGSGSDLVETPPTPSQLGGKPGPSLVSTITKPFNSLVPKFSAPSSSTASATSATSTFSSSTGYEAGSISAILELMGQEVTHDEVSLVYVVNDNQELRDHFVQVLEEHWRAQGFSNGAAALDACKKALPSVILCDIMMPVMNGFRLLKTLRERDDTKDIPVILMSNKTGVDVRITSLQAGADDYMVKPFSNKELNARVKTQLDLAQLRSELKLKLKIQTEQTESHLSVLNDVVMLNPVVFFSLDTIKIKYCNAKFAAMCGYSSSDELLQDVESKKFSFLNIVLPEYREKLVSIYRNDGTTTKKEINSYEFQIMKGRATIWIEAHGIMRYKPDGSLSGSINTFKDVTHQKILQEERIRSLEEKRAAQKLRADEAEESRQHQENFIDMICHEIRNPLSGIANNNDFIKETFQQIKATLKLLNADLPEVSNHIEQGLQFVENIAFCTRHQKTIADQVLKVSKLNMNLVVIDKNVPFNPIHLVFGICGSFAAEFRSNEIEHEVIASERLQNCCGHFMGDPPRLSQVLINLIANAIKFTLVRPARKITITVGLLDIQEPEVDLNCTLSFSVTDTGAGMTQEDITKLFKRFSQTSKTNEYGGSGLGLFISKNLVELMGGKMEVASTKGGGTTFSFTIKANYRASSENAGKRKSIEDFRAAPTKLLRTASHDGKFIIMIVDDNKVNRQILEKHLKMHHVVTAINGLEAVDLVYAQDRQYDLILMDLEMPIMSGPLATEKIREFEAMHPECKRIPVIAVTGNARPAQIQETLSHGIDSVLTKPFDKDGLYKILREFLDL